MDVISILGLEINLLFVSLDFRVSSFEVGSLESQIYRWIISYFTRSQLQLSLRKQNFLVRNFQCTDIFATGRETMIEGHDHGADSRWNVTPSSVVYHRTTGFGLDSKLARIPYALCRDANFVPGATLFISCHGCTLCACIVTQIR